MKQITVEAFCREARAVGRALELSRTILGQDGCRVGVVYTGRHELQPYQVVSFDEMPPVVLPGGCHVIYVAPAQGETTVSPGQLTLDGHAELDGQHADAIARDDRRDERRAA